MGKEGMVLEKGGGVLLKVDSQAEIKEISYGIKQNQRKILYFRVVYSII